MCGACAKACPKALHAVSAAGHIYERAACSACGACAAACPAGALELSGYETETGEVLAQVLRDAEFYRASGGGLTLSGGEPMAQPEFALELVQGARRAGLHVCVETCGCCARDALKLMLPYVDLFLYDFKLADGEAHRLFTGSDNALILDNLSFLSEAGAALILRCPIIPGVNFSDEHFEAVRRAAEMYPGIRGIDLEPYHDLGVEKALRLGRADICRSVSPDRDKLRKYRKWLQDRTSVGVDII